MGGKVDKIEKNLMYIEEEKSLEILELKKMIRKLEEGQVEAQKNLLDLVESCQSMEDMSKNVENVNWNLLKQVKNLQTEKEIWVNSLSKSDVVTYLLLKVKNKPLAEVPAPPLVRPLPSPNMRSRVHTRFQVTIHLSPTSHTLPLSIFQPAFLQIS